MATALLGQLLRELRFEPVAGEPGVEVLVAVLVIAQERLVLADEELEQAVGGQIRNGLREPRVVVVNGLGQDFGSFLARDRANGQALGPQPLAKIVEKQGADGRQDPSGLGYRSVGASRCGRRPH